MGVVVDVIVKPDLHRLDTPLLAEWYQRSNTLTFDKYIHLCAISAHNKNLS